ncbi:tetratricopeptide repeat protein [Actinokineospora sp. NBRC 105648]|uniref:tetratricopeptide repeat protein n=1 Tax=Actinokineospora sp. NBRC 105648 TaxID=3032206 RepID=UPI0024A38EB6|nr:tetratricopeptide repeat protein [Actinokineospora sp. NBRC 105648]GLZ41987.1 hypothetical protein Acsp05_56110 [Actinokineospora sp. NBRC 105648]
MSADRARWLRLVESRVERFAEDPAVVLGPEALREAENLFAAAEPDVEAVVAVAWLHWLRVDLLPADEAEVELERAISLFTEVWDLAPDSVPVELRDVLGEDAGVAEFLLYLADGDADVLDVAVDRLRESADADPTIAARSGNLAAALCERFVLAGREVDLDEAIAVAARAVAAAEPGSRSRGGVLATSAAVLRARYESRGEVADLDTAVAQYRAAVGDPDDPAATNAIVLTNLVTALVTRFEAHGELADLDEAISTARAVTDPIGDTWSALGLALRTRYDRTGSVADLDEALVAARKAVRETESEGDHAGALSCLSGVHGARYRLHQDLAELDAAIETARAAVAVGKGAHREVYRSNLGDLLHDRFTATADEEDLAAAINILRQALQGTPDLSPHRPSCVANLGQAMLSRYERQGTAADVDEAVVLARQGVELARLDNMDGPRIRALLAQAVQARFEDRGAVADLDEAVELARSALGSVAREHPEYPTYLGILATAQWARFPWTADPADLEEAVEVARAAVELARTNEDRAAHESNLSVVLGSRHELTGRPADLEEAVAAARRAVGVTAPGSPALARRLANLSAVLRSRFEDLGSIEDIDEAVVCARAAVAVAPVKSPERAAWWSTLTGVLQSRYGQSAQLADLDEAVDAAREAARTTPPTAPAFAGRLSNLGNALLRRSGEPADLLPFLASPGVESTVSDDLIEAVQAMRDAVAAVLPGAHDHAALCANLAMTLLSLYYATGESAVLEESVEWARRAVERTTADQPDLALHQADLGVALAALAAVTGAEDVLTESLALLRQAAGVRTAPPLIRMVAARRRGEVAGGAGRVPEAVAGFTEAVRLLGVTSWHGLDRRSRERHLAAALGLATDAGAWAIHSGQSSLSVELLESGRSVLWSQLLDAAPDLTAVTTADPALGARLLEVGRLLNRELGHRDRP